MLFKIHLVLLCFDLMPVTLVLVLFPDIILVTGFDTRLGFCIYISSLPTMKITIFLKLVHP